MEPKGIASLRYFFEKYAFDTDRRELHRGADVVPLAPQVFDLLDYLIRNRERVSARTTSSTPSGMGVSCPMRR